MEEEIQNQKQKKSSSGASLGLKLSYWYVTHKLQLKAMVVAVLIVLNIGLFGYVAWRATDLLYLQWQPYQQQLAELSVQPIDYKYFQQANAPSPLQVTAFEVTGGQNGKFDFTARLYNPNEQQYAQEVHVEFVAGGKVIAESVGYILPGDQRYFFALGKEAQFTGDAQIRITDVKWRRVRGYQELAPERLNFSIDDIEFTPASDLRIGNEAPVSSLSFTVRNNTAYSYWEAGVATVLVSGSGTAAVSRITLDQFRAGETREVEVRWTQNLPPITNAEVVMDIDILNPELYMPTR